MGQLAAVVGRSTSAVRRWERDQGLPTKAVVQELIDVLNLDQAETAVLIARPLPAAAAAAIAVDDSSSEESSDATRATPSPPTHTTPQAVAPPEETVGWFASLHDPEMPWLGYLRAALTVGGLLVLGWIAIWALLGFLDAFGDIWESLWVDTP